MIVKKYVQVETEIEVDVTMDDFIASLPTNSETVFFILRGYNNIASFMMRIPDKLINELKEDERKLIASFLHKQAKRFEIQKVEA